MYHSGNSMPQITPDDVKHVARLARLALSEYEIPLYADQLSAVFEFVEQLKEVTTDGVAETCQVTGLEDVVRGDKVKKCDEDVRKKLLAMFPEHESGLLKVQGVFAE